MERVGEVRWSRVWGLARGGATSRPPDSHMRPPLSTLSHTCFAPIVSRAYSGMVAMMPLTTLDSRSSPEGDEGRRGGMVRRRRFFFIPSG